METIVKIDNPASNEITVRNGEALKPVAPEKIRISGNISAVSDFLRVRKEKGSGFQSIDLSKAVVLVNKRDLMIRLLLDPENHYGAEVTSKLEYSDELKAFYINQSKTFTREELIKLIRFNKLFFGDADKHAGLLASYMAFNATSNADIKQESDTRGNRANHLVKKVETNVPTEFILNIPIFKGGEKERFRVEICLDVTDGGARFWFESVELNEIVQTRVDEIFQYELESCAGFVVIHQ